MAGHAVPGMKGVRVFPPAPKGFDALAASKSDLARHGLPQRPDARSQPGLAALWGQRARRYRGFEQLEPKLLPPTAAKAPVPAGLGLSPIESCGYELTSLNAPITVLSGTWTVPNLNHSPAAGPPNHFRTFFGLGFLDVHVEMTVDAAQSVTSLIRIHTGAQLALPVGPGDVISAVLCLETNAAGTAAYFLANETTSQAMNLQIDTGFPPAVIINAGVSRGGQVNAPPDPLARFGVVYFDEVVAYSTSGTRLLTDGVPTTMTDLNGSTLAIPQRLSDFAFKAIYRAG